MLSITEQLQDDLYEQAKNAIGNIGAALIPEIYALVFEISTGVDLLGVWVRQQNTKSKHFYTKLLFFYNFC
jgi:hypothetical protein